MPFLVEPSQPTYQLYVTCRELQVWSFEKNPSNRRRDTAEIVQHAHRVIGVEFLKKSVEYKARYS
jgi:hypothetical protein